MKKALLLLSFMVVIGGITISVLASPAMAAPSDYVQQGVNDIGGNENGKNVPIQDRIITITNTLLFITGALGVVMVIIGGIRLTLSGGDAAAVKTAKNIILYAVIGIVVALLAFAIVQFVIRPLTNPPNNTSTQQPI